MHLGRPRADAQDPGEFAIVAAGHDVFNDFFFRSVSAWLRHGWCVILGYAAGYLMLLVFLGWQPMIAA